MVSAISTTTEIEARLDSPPTTASPTSRPVLPAMRAALDTVAPQLRACGSEAGLFIEFTIEAGQNQFASIHVIGDHKEHVDRCVRAAVADLRFAPTTAQIVHEAYTP